MTKLNKSSLEELTNADNDVEVKSNQEITLDRALRELFEDNNIVMKSDLTASQVSSITKGLVFADKYKSKTMSKFVNHLLKLSVSKDRKGRTELVDVVRTSNEVDDNDSGLMSKLFSK